MVILQYITGIVLWQNIIAKIAKAGLNTILQKKLNKNNDHIYKITRIFEILYGNLNHGHWANLVEL